MRLRCKCTCCRQPLLSAPASSVALSPIRHEPTSDKLQQDCKRAGRTRQRKCHAGDQVLRKRRSQSRAGLARTFAVPNVPLCMYSAATEAFQEKYAFGPRNSTRQLSDNPKRGKEPIRQPQDNPLDNPITLEKCAFQRFGEIQNLEELTSFNFS